MNNKNIRWFIGILVVVLFVLPPVSAITSFENANDVTITDLDLNNGKLELTSMRIQNAKYYSNPDGTTTAEIHMDAIHYKNDAGEWQDIDTTILPYSNPGNEYDYACEENGLEVYFEGDYSNPNSAIKTASNGYWLTWEPLGMTIENAKGLEIFTKKVNNVDGELEDNKMTYLNAFLSTNDEYIISPNQLKHNFILLDSPKDLAAEANPNDELTLDYYGYLEFNNELSIFVDNNELSTENLELVTSSAIEFRDASDNGVFRLPSPMAYEQGFSLNFVECQYELKAVKDTNTILFSIKTPYSWLVNPERRYPVVIDPTTETIQPGPGDGEDTFICNSFGAYMNEYLNFGGDQDIWMAHDVSSSSGFFPFRGLLLFDISPIPLDADIETCELKLYYYRSIATDQTEAGETSQMTITANPITKAWTEGSGEWSAATLVDVNWINASTGDQWSTQGGDFSGSYSGSGQTPTSYGWTAIDCKLMVNAWLDSSINNIGMILRADQAHEYLKYFRSSDYTTAGERPKLEVTYVSNHKPNVKSSAIDNLNFYEDDPTTYIDLNDIFNDQDDGDVLTFSIWTGSEWNEVQPYDSLWITAEILVNDSVEVTPKPNKFGADTIQLNATDTSSEYAHHSIIVVILPVNDAPRINATTEWKVHNVIPPPEISPGKVKGKEDVYINLTVSAYDPVERDALTYSDNTTLFNIDSKTGYISFRPKNSDVGTHYVEIEVDDGGMDNNIDTLNVEFVITNTNDAPVILRFVHGATIDTVTPAQDTVELSDSAKQGQYYNFTVVAIDDDMSTPLGDMLGFKITPEEKFTVKKDTIDPTKANISFMPTNEDVGDFEAEVRVTDSINYFDEIKIIIEVKNVNDAPVIFQIKKGIYDEDIDEDQTEVRLEDENEATEHKSYTFTVLVRELDPNDVVEFSTDNNKLYKLTANDDETDEEENIIAKDITFTPTWEHGRLGYATINVTVKDNLKAFDWLIVNVSVKNQNDAPMIIGQGIDADTNDTDKSTRTLEENLTWTFVAEGIVDPDGDRIFYYWDFDENDGRTDDEDAEGRWVMWTFAEGNTYTITLTVMDSNNAINTTSETITVTPPGTSSRGADGDKDAGFPFEWLIIGIVILLVIIMIVAFLFLKKKREEQEAEEEEEMAQIAAQAAAGTGYGYAYTGAEAMAGMPGMAATPTTTTPEQDQYGGLTPEQYAMFQQYQTMYPSLTLEQFTQYMQQYAQMTPEQYQQYQQQYAQAMGQQSPEYAQQTYDMGGMQQQPMMGTGAAPQEPELSLPPAAAASGVGEGEELQAKLPPATEQEPEPEPAPKEKAAPPKPKIKQPKIKSGPKVKEPAGDAPEGEGTSDTCSNCGTPIKSGWFICPECKNPII